MPVLVISALAFVATLLGGAFALYFRDRLHLILGFSAGAVIGVALFDLLPESMMLTRGNADAATLAAVIAAGFFVYLIIDRLILLHPHSHKDPGHPHDAPKAGGALGALTLVAHSFLDGVAIGAGFQASPAVGAIVAAAVVTHDFSDGINTVAFVLRVAGNPKRALPWLLLDGIAPVAGAAFTLLFRLDPSVTGLVLAAFTGCFLYLGASDLIPESQHAHPRAATTLMTLLGAGVLYVAVRIWGG